MSHVCNARSDVFTYNIHGLPLFENKTSPQGSTIQNSWQMKINTNIFYLHTQIVIENYGLVFYRSRFAYNLYKLLMQIKYIRVNLHLPRISAV
jgi:hypothetical protein